MSGLKILTVDDSRAVRSIIRKQVTELGFEVVEAEDGEQGLLKLKECPVDLVLLDVTMPVLDGPGMLARMRESGDKTPVIMLTSESKRSIVANAMKLGIEDYILKPFKPEELKAKLMSVLDKDTGGGGTVEEEASIIDTGLSSSRGIAGGGPEPKETGKAFIDVLLVDDMENVAKKLRSLMPQHISIVSYTSAQAALASCREKVYRVVLVDTEMPDASSSVLARQIKVLQPHAAVLAMPLRTTNDVSKELKEQGFDDHLFKPFNQDSIEDFLIQYFDNQELVMVEDNLIKVGKFSGREERLDKYFARLTELFPEALKKVASASYDEVVVDMSVAPARQDRLPRVLISLAGATRAMGMDLRMVGSPEIKKIAGSFDETKSVPVYNSVEEARKG